jgi:RNA polymerase sigma factor (sigma-70 family)
MSDSEVVASIVAGDPEGLAAAYDKYAGDLYGYCQSLLKDPNDAADAVQDTFVIAVSKLAGLRDPERLRAWLFAVARNECLHRLKSRRMATPLHDAPEPADDSVDVGGEVERAETVALVRAAVGGLNDSERDVVNQLWHGLDVPEAAAVLGVSRNHAYSLFSRARDQLEASVAVLLVGRTGRGECATLDSLLGDWDGRLTALLRKRVGRHIDRCPVCSDRRRRELTPALLYGLSPAALLGLAALRKISVLTASQPGGPLSAVRDTVLHLSADSAARTAAYGAVTGRRTQSFGANGFPKPPHHGFLGAGPRPHVPFTVAGGTAVAAAAAVVVTAVVPHLQPAPRPAGGGLTLGAPAPGGAPPAGGTGGSASSGAPAAGSATRGGRTPPPGAPGATAGGRSVTASAAGSGGGSLVGSPAGSPVGSAAPTAPAAGTVSGAPATAATSAAATVTTSAGAVSAGTLSVSPTTVLLSPLLGGSLTLTASGGPVSWSISEPASLLGELIVTPTSGTLSAGGSVTVAITVSGLASLDTQLTVQPGDHGVTVVLGLA